MSSRAPETGRSRAVPFLVLALVALALLTGPVRAAEGDPSTDDPGPDLEMTPDEAFDAMNDVIANGDFWPLDIDLHFLVLDDLLLEIALLDHLDAFTTPTPTFVRDIHAAYGPWPDAPRASTVDFLLDVDDGLADLKNRVNEAAGPSPVLAFALDELPPDTRARIADGDTALVEVVHYAKALTEMLSFGNADELAAMGAPNAAIIDALPIELFNPELPSDLDDLRAEAVALPGNPDPLPLTVAPDATTDSPRADIAAAPDTTTVGDPEPSAGFPWVIAVAVVGGSIAVGALVWLVRRRRSPDDSTDDRAVTAEIFEAHRLLAAALDETQIGEIGCSTATSITTASDAAIFRLTPDGLRRTGDTSLVVTSALDRVVDTAQPLVTVVTDDAAVGSAAVCAVPLVNNGTVVAVLVARRPVTQPFGNEDRRRLEMLAPALGGALASADTLGSYEHMALVDGLTSLGNRRRLDGDLETTLRDAVETNLPVAFAMIDVDHFKHYNDTHGHEAGDRALQSVAQVIADTVRASDIVYRYGGEEFSVLLPGATFEEATTAAERMRAAVEAARFDGEESQPGGCLTISVGISTLEGGRADELKTRADEALYAAKAHGRNRAVVA